MGLLLCARVKVQPKGPVSILRAKYFDDPSKMSTENFPLYGSNRSVTMMGDTMGFGGAKVGGVGYSTISQPTSMGYGAVTATPTTYSSYSTGGVVTGQTYGASYGQVSTVPVTQPMGTITSPVTTPITTQPLTTNVTYGGVFQRPQHQSLMFLPSISKLL